MLTRRGFLKSGCAACLGLVSAGILLDSCSSALPLIKLKQENDHILKVPVSNFSESQTMLVVRSDSLENDILLTRKDGQYKALYLHCTHEGMALIPTSSKIYCNAHGSEFDLSGNVIKEPALKPLKQFRTELLNNEIIIHLI